VSAVPAGPVAADEGRHAPGPGVSPTFVEIWSFAAHATPIAPAVEVEVGLRPTVDDAWFSGLLVLPEVVVVVLETHVGRVTGRGLELRTSGLWADQVVEEPLRRWGLGLEAFGIALPADELVGLDLGNPDLRGERVPVGWDLEWEHDVDPRWYDTPDGVSAYGGPARVYGEVLLGADTFELAGTGHRSHRWGPGVVSAIHAAGSGGPG
jgi:hypothetical protein